jgi:hypothetical protein
VSAGDQPEGGAPASRTVGFSYAVIRAVPRVERGEFVNIGVIIYCQDRDYLKAAIAIDDVRLRALDHQIDLDMVSQAAESITRRCLDPVGSARENDGLLYRFGILTAPRSTVVQTSPVHAGITDDPERTLTELMGRLVAPLA